MLKKYDFVFVYEIKPREFETMALLSYELKRRGYTVGYVNTWKSAFYLFKGRMSAKVVLAYAAYDTDIVDYVLEHVVSCEKYINLQWEQILSMADIENKSSYYYLKEKATQVAHISWGNVNYNKLVDKCHIEPRLIAKTGHVGMDFLRDEFKGYYKSRREMCKEYNIPEEKKLLLFISSFSYVKMPDKLAEILSEFTAFSVESHEAMLQWFEELLHNRDDVVLVYRPHPAEAQNEDLFKMQERLGNFRVIKDYSVKQWITVADKIYNWYSTSLMEVFMARKSCYILRPTKVPPAQELEILQTADFVTDKETFFATVDDEEETFPVSEETMYEFYTVDKDEPAYIKAVDFFEKVYKDDSYTLPQGFKPPFVFDKRRAIYRVPPFNIIRALVRKAKYKKGDADTVRQIQFEKYCADMQGRNYVPVSEIEALSERFGKLLERVN